MTNLAIPESLVSGWKSLRSQYVKDAGEQRSALLKGGQPRPLDQKQ